MIVIHSRARDGFRRAGQEHPAGRSEYPADAFTAEQLEQLQAEPLFTVEVAEAAKAPAKGKKDA
jgi:hypothetical protein